MKNLIIFSFLLLFAACTQKRETQQATDKDYQSYGATITPDEALTPAAFLTEMEGKSSARMKLAANIDACCQAKGCWMKMNMENGEQLMVRFKDYGFFVPIDSEGKTAIIEGEAFLDTVSVEELQHFAADAGKSEAEINAITEPEYTLAFTADGVLIAE
jgi:HJR/Mrr/RecB family endonuclease